jgi:small-conductance mechanosensitive channel
MATTTKNTMKKTTEPAKGAKPEEIEKHIESTRADLGETVEALSHKLDVRSQAQEKLASVRDKAGAMVKTIKLLAMKPATMIAAGATVVAAGVAGTVAWKRRH